MFSKCFLSKGKCTEGYFLKLNQDSVREMTICHHPQREEINPRTSVYPF